jgi:hypothetical protein
MSGYGNPLNRGGVTGTCSRSRLQFVLADDPGVSKTIMAGLLLG